MTVYCKLKSFRDPNTGLSKRQDDEFDPIIQKFND
jgi:hypothetical protein